MVMVFERFSDELVCLSLMGEIAALAQNLPFDIAHVPLCDKSPATEIITLKYLLKDHQVFVDYVVWGDGIWMATVFIIVIKIQSFVLK